MTSKCQMSAQFDAESVFKIFQEIDQGLITNAHFSDANVVMVSKEHYAALVDAWDTLNTERENHE